jgi:Uncharacterized membrane protein
MKKIPIFCKKIFKIGAILGLAAAALIVAAEIAVSRAAMGRVYDDAGAIPVRGMGLLLGCGKTLKNGGANSFFTHRADAAAKLYAEEKISQIIVSGDNHVASYDEATDMKLALVERGVPAERIHCDYAGFRTLDSVVRAKKVFGQERLTIISQSFHNRRAIFIARAKGVDAIGFNAAEVAMSHSLRTRIRETPARVKALLDVCLGVRPRFLGPAIDIDLALDNPRQ